MEKWKSTGLYEHPAKHQAGTFGYIGQSQVGIYYLMVGGSRMSCPQDWAAKIHAEETRQKIVIKSRYNSASRLKSMICSRPRPPPKDSNWLLI